MTPSSISGRSSPSTDRAVVVSSSVPSSIRLTTVRAVKPFIPLAIANRVSVAFGIACARSASPYACASSTPPELSTRTTPENPVSWAIASTASWSVCIG